MKILRKKHFRAYIIGIIFSSITLIMLLLPNYEQLHAHGPMNTGHEKLKCNHCHISAKGSLRQQLQANIQFMLGLRKKPAAIGYEKIQNKTCIACHERPKDNHPVYRFFEPKFQLVRQKIQPQYCSSCHLEHYKKHVTIDMRFCQHCHEELRIKNDRISTPHITLVKNKKWRTCLGCHDFHGNHKMQLKEKLREIHPSNIIAQYFNGAHSPYSKDKFYKAKQTP